MSAFLVFLIVACLGLWVGGGVVSVMRNYDRTTRRARDRYEDVPARHRRIARNGFKTRMGAK